MTRATRANKAPDDTTAAITSAITATATSAALSVFYKGERTPEGVVVTRYDEATGREIVLSLRLNLRNHSPTGFEWGYGGSGPAQLALALVADALSKNGRRAAATDALALAVYQEFKWRVVAALPQEAQTWRLTQAEVRRVAQEIMLEREQQQRLTAAAPAPL